MLQFPTMPEELACALSMLLCLAALLILILLAKRIVRMRRQKQADTGTAILDTETAILGTEAENLPQTATYSESFAPLPEGALLHQGRYIVREIRSSSEQLNVYLVEDLIPLRQCPNCNTVIPDLEEQFCTSCGIDLSSVQPVNLRYLLEESPDDQTFALELWLIGRGLQHPGLLLPKDFFAESTYGPERQYRVIPEFSLPLAVDLSVPQELNTVLAWGIALAQGMEHLHRYQIAFREVGLSHIAIDQQRAFWTDLNRAYLIPPESRGTREQIYAANIRGLAALLLYLATGQNDQVEDTALPEFLKAILDQAINTSSALTAADFGAQLEATLQELRRPESVLFAVGCRTDVGQVRSLNEDSLLTLHITPIFHSISQPVGIFAVADGMGGHEAGDIASQIVIRTVAQQAVQAIFEPAAGEHLLPEIKEWLTNVTLAANQLVYDQRKTARNDMGTTLVMMLLVGDMATLVNVGDSRCYHLNASGITQITTDHSLVERMVATGQITREEAAQHPQKNVIYRVMGDKPKLSVDIYEKRLNEGEVLLLCSDGLSGMVSDKHIWNIWRTSTSPQDACDRLVNAANQAGGEDNITVVIVQMVQ
ncbi:MAG: Stp1/IreP family PP2C-type Ser/Thr phosphatase [Anaerolineae bacterium]|nr:Stp1/IreP family PP2C-type Ser/Thr phosphatase [Anaerolineae bacterium]